MPNSYFYSNIASPTTLSGNINNSVTSATVAATTGWPGTTPYIVALDFGTANEELVKVTNNSAGTLTIVRGFGGTSAVSHSTGAIVRHVYNAQDATDFRTHEAASAAVHGIAGSVVGTTDVQTLTQKTLTSPTINTGTFASGGSLAGTFSGTPTFSGALTLSGTPNITNGAALTGTFTGTPTFNGNVVFSGAPNFTGIPTYGQALATAASATTATWRTAVNADTFDRFYIEAGGKHWWGPGNATQDTNLYRSAADTLKTDDDFVVVGNISAANLTTGAQSTYTPAWSTSTGANTPSFGNATVNGYYAKFGRMTYFNLKITFGSTTNFGGGGGADNWQFTLPGVCARTDETIGTWTGRSGSGNAGMGDLRTTSGDASKMILSLAAGRPDATAVTSVGFVDSVTPFTWASGDQLRCQGFFEATF